MKNAEVTVMVPSFNTLELTKLCLRSLRKYSDDRLRVMVVDNGSTDGSVEYLKSLDWILFVPNFMEPCDGMAAAEQHARSLDLLLEKISTPLCLSIHTDTIVRNADWLDFLLDKMNGSPEIAGVGSWKLSNWSFCKRCIKKAEDFIRFNILFPLTGRKFDPDSQYRYLRSHCAMYRTDLLKSRTRGFFDGAVAGKSIHKMLTAAGYRMVFIEEHEMLKYINHFDHATMILNPDIFAGKTSKKRARKKLGKALNVPEFDIILADDSLDK